MSKIMENHIVKLLFVLLFVYLVWQHYYVFLYFDDYGHASLSYGHVVKGMSGTDLTLNHLLEWTSWYYNEWGGRVLYYFLFLIPLLSQSITLFMLIQAVIVFFIFVYMYKLIREFQQEFHPVFIIGSLISLYGLISIEIMRESAYWASASICYIWSILPLIMGIYYFIKVTKEEHHPRKREIMGISILFFLAASGFEQSAAAAFVFIASTMGLWIVKRKSLQLPITVPAFVFSLTGVLIQYLAPGNKERIEAMHEDFSKLSLLGKVRQGIPNVVNLIFDIRVTIFIVILCLLCFAIVILKKESAKRIPYTFVIYPLALPAFFLVKGFFNFGMEREWQLLLLVIIFLYFVYFMWEKEEFMVLTITVAASIFCLVLSPVLQLRSLAFYLILLFIPISIVFNSLIISLKGYGRHIILAIFLVILAFSINNYKNIWVGYKKNHEYAMYNHQLLKSYSTGEKGKIILYKYPHEYTREHMPYDPTTPFISKWMIEYYALPEDTEFEWVDPK
jgi:hypothetical protein